MYKPKKRQDMKKFKNMEAYLKDNEMTREDMKEMILRTSLDLLGECAHNFSGDPQPSENASIPLITLNNILDKVE